MFLLEPLTGCPPVTDCVTWKNKPNKLKMLSVMMFFIATERSQEQRMSHQFTVSFRPTMLVSRCGFGFGLCPIASRIFHSLLAPSRSPVFIISFPPLLPLHPPCFPVHECSLQLCLPSPLYPMNIYIYLLCLFGYF